VTPVLLYDGACGLCAASVQFVLRHERRRGLRFAPLQGPFAAAVRDRHPELAGVDSMIWIESAVHGERIYVRSAAVLRVARYLGGAWRLAAAGWLLPQSWRDALYDTVARHRHELFAPEQCYLPPADVRSRFLD
jgi:predicted DCC family thiol-disulfide oxidoreductase YuxK